MKIKIEMDEQAEEEVIIRCRGMTEQIEPFREQSVRQPGQSRRSSSTKEIPSIIFR